MELTTKKTTTRNSLHYSHAERILQILERERRLNARMIDDSKNWTTVEWGGQEYRVPVTGRDENMNAMLTVIPGQDDQDDINDGKFGGYAMAFLMQDGNLMVPGGRYGSTTADCADTAIAMAKIMQYHNGELITYYQLDSDMGAVVNSSDDVADMIRENAELVGLDPDDYPGTEDDEAHK